MYHLLIGCIDRTLAFHTKQPNSMFESYLVTLDVACGKPARRRYCMWHAGTPRDGAIAWVQIEYLYRRVATTHDLNAILYPPSSENTVRYIAV